ncbi:hypothetical protein P154DRAFT_354551 [Amniculicola lignicola CBS 123094]|uniref:Uncharacterized protein n=1 Tax=Amniculicola lignicola CBS 123094 TaxID=1392246 RepID=A0A6A5WW64_9PLEO|nr:hypothetical protein P154DRAFT_354551 [Amniculicola lignicola CBS 123094]
MLVHDVKPSSKLDRSQHYPCRASLFGASTRSQICTRRPRPSESLLWISIEDPDRCCFPCTSTWDGHRCYQNSGTYAPQATWQRKPDSSQKSCAPPVRAHGRIRVAYSYLDRIQCGPECMQVGLELTCFLDATSLIKSPHQKSSPTQCVKHRNKGTQVPTECEGGLYFLSS